MNVCANKRTWRHWAGFQAGVAHELGAPLSVIDADARRLIAGTVAG